MGVRLIDIKKCNGCGICVDDCPMDVLYLNKENKAYVKYTEDCHECYVCEIYCPEKAIEVSPVVARKLHFGYEI